MQNNFFSFFQKKSWYVFVFSILVFASCKKDTNITTPPVSGLMAFNLIPDSASTIVFALSNSNLTNIPLSYINYTGAYLSVYSGNRELKSINAKSDSVLSASTFLFEPQKYYSAFTLGANGVYRNVISDDNLDSLPANTGNAFVRYINAIPDSSEPKITIVSNGNNVIDESTSFGNISAFTGITPGNISVNIDNDSTINANRIISVEKDKVYTILLLGIPKVTDTTRTVKIKYIQNGTIIH